MPAAAPEQLARWRIRRAFLAGRPPDTLDTNLLGLEEVEKIREQAEARLSKAQQSIKSPPLQQPSQQPETRSQDSLPRQESTVDPASYDVPPNVVKLSDRPRGKKEREWYDFWAHQFGPIVVLTLLVFVRDQEKAVFYAPTPQECADIAPYMARLTVKIEGWLSVPVFVSETILSSKDYVPVMVTVFGYLNRVGALDALLPWFAEKATKGRSQHGETEPREYAQGLQPESNGRSNGYDQPAIDPRTVYGLGAQWAAD